MNRRKLFNPNRYSGKKVNLRSSVNLTCLKLINYGFHASTINEITGLTHSQIYLRARLYGKKLRDYRNGLGPIGEVVIKKFKVIRQKSTG